MRSSNPHFHIFRVAAVMITVALALPGRRQTITTIASTIPSNGDLNPYGVAQIPATSGALIKRKLPCQQLQQHLESARYGYDNCANQSNWSG